MKCVRVARNLDFWATKSIDQSKHPFIDKKEKEKGKKKRKPGHLIVAPMAVKPQPCYYGAIAQREMTADRC